MQAKKRAKITESTDEGEAGPSKETATTAEDSDRLFPPDVYQRYLELSRRPKSNACSCCGAEAAEKGGKKLQVCSTCHRKAYCSAACQRQDWKEGGHKLSCRPRKDFRKDDVVVAQGVESQPELNGQLMVVVGPASEGRWLVMDARRKSISLRAGKLRLVVPVEERERGRLTAIDFHLFNLGSRTLIPMGEDLCNGRFAASAASFEGSPPRRTVTPTIPTASPHIGGRIKI